MTDELAKRRMAQADKQRWCAEQGHPSFRLIEGREICVRCGLAVVIEPD